MGASLTTRDAVVVAGPRLPLVFALPAGSDAPSGGNVYNYELTRALDALVPVTVTTFDGARSALEAAKPGIFFFDTLELERTAALAAPHPDQLLGLVVHHLPSLEPDAPAHGPELDRENALLARFACLLATSDFTRALLAGRSFDERSILTVPPALDPVPVVTPRTYEPPLTALLVANLVPRKGVLELLAALAALARDDPPLSLRIAGREDMDPAYAGACRTLVAAAPHLAPRVRFEGAVPHERMGALYDGAALLVSASSMETFGMAIHEARAHGLPVVAVEGGYSLRHFADGASGLGCANAEEAAATLVALARDEPRMAALFANAQATRASSDRSWTDAACEFLEALARTGV